MPVLRFSACTTTSALGHGVEATCEALRRQRSGLRLNDFTGTPLPVWIGAVDGLETVRLPERLAAFDCRNHRLAQIALMQDGFAQAVAAAVRRLGASRIGLFLGTSTSGIERTEAAYRERTADGALPAAFSYPHSQSLHAVTAFVAASLGLEGPAQTVSTACSSSAKVFGMAARYIDAGLCDAAVVGGVDSLCLTTLYGFGSLELLSSEPCRPWDTSRNGISIGEAAGFALLEPAAADDDAICLLGYGESSDAWHMSAPHPDGRGAHAAMAQALASAGLPPSAVDYINLHGTATPANDAAEDRAVCELFGQRPRCSSTKGWTGHTLGAAGITEAVIAALAVERSIVPGSLNTRTPDPALRCRLQLDTDEVPLKVVMSNSFGFGGSNCALLIGRPV